MKTKILVLCTGNACRSQMAEGILRHYGNDKFKVFSAGTKPSGKVNKHAVQVMNEIGVDISKHRSKHLDEFKDQTFDYVITVCDYAKEACPVYWKASKKLHWGFPDPSHSQEITEEEMDEFRRVRDMIHKKFKGIAETGEVS